MAYSFASTSYADITQVLDLSKSGRTSQRDPYYAPSHSRNDRPTSAYSEQRESSNSPDQRMVDYNDFYPGAEHLSHYVLHAAYQQQLVLQNADNRPSSAEQDASNQGSPGSPLQAPDVSIYPLISPTRDGKVTRPFKAYPKDPLSLTVGLDSVLDAQSTEKYAVFREKMLAQIKAANGGQATVSNPKMRRTVNTNNNNIDGFQGGEGNGKSQIPGKDNSYSERRKKNNAAAKKSRDRRRIKEDEIAIRAAYLERENIELKFELVSAQRRCKELVAKHANCSM